MRCDQERPSISGGGIRNSDGIYGAVTLHTYSIKVRTTGNQGISRIVLPHL